MSQSRPAEPASGFTGYASCLHQRSQGLSQGVPLSALVMDRNQALGQLIPLEVNSPSKQGSCRTHLGEVWNP